VGTPRDMCSAITCTNSSDLHHCLLSDSVTLTRQGDYVTWGPGIAILWQAESDSVVITVRWPSASS
jgi:hypothetical protein